MWFLSPVCQVAILCYFIPKDKITIINLVNIIRNHWIRICAVVMSGVLWSFCFVNFSLDNDLDIFIWENIVFRNKFLLLVLQQNQSRALSLVQKCFLPI